MNSEGKTTVFPGPGDDRFPWASQVAVSVAVAGGVRAVAVISNVVRPKKEREAYHWAVSVQLQDVK